MSDKDTESADAFWQQARKARLATAGRSNSDSTELVRRRRDGDRAITMPPDQSHPKKGTARFERYVGLDWSGAKDSRPPIRVCTATLDSPPKPEDPPTKRAKNWSPDEVKSWLLHALTPDAPRTICGFDFGFGYPIGSEVAVFHSHSWRDLLTGVRERLKSSGAAKALASDLNDEFCKANGCQGPFFNQSEAPSAHPYRAGGFGYYRLTELFIPEAKSQWYVGPGAQVGQSTITGLSMLACLLEQRDELGLEFVVWPHESQRLPSNGHVLVETYPSLMGRKRKAKNQHAADAKAISAWLKRTDESGELTRYLDLPEVVGKQGLDFEQVRHRVGWEGWIIGV